MPSRKIPPRPPILRFRLLIDPGAGAGGGPREGERDGDWLFSVIVHIAVHLHYETRRGQASSP